MRPNRLPGGELWALFLLIHHASEEEPKTARELIVAGSHPLAPEAGDATVMVLADKLKRRLGELAFYQLADGRNRGGQPKLWWPTERGRAWWAEHGTVQDRMYRGQKLSEHVSKLLEGRVGAKWRAYARAVVDHELELRLAPSRRPQGRRQDVEAVERVALAVLAEAREATQDGRSLIA